MERSERLVAQQLFTQDGRRYVKGTPTAKCQYAYLEAPHFSAVDKAEGRLKISAKFSGRSSLDVFGRCVGLGDSFDLTIQASPVARKGVIAMDNVQVTTRQGLLLHPARAPGLDATASASSSRSTCGIKPRPFGAASRQFHVSAGAESGFDLSEVRVTPDALVLVVEFKLVVK